MWADCCSVALHTCRNVAVWRTKMCFLRRGTRVCLYWKQLTAGKVETGLKWSNWTLEWNPSTQTQKCSQTKTGPPNPRGQMQRERAGPVHWWWDWAVSAHTHTHTRPNTAAGQDPAVHLHLQEKAPSSRTPTMVWERRKRNSLALICFFKSGKRFNYPKMFNKYIIEEIQSGLAASPACWNFCSVFLCTEATTLVHTERGHIPQMLCIQQKWWNKEKSNQFCWGSNSEMQ